MKLAIIIASMLLSIGLFAQNATIKGIIKFQNDTINVPFASITLNNSKGVYTDEDGQFSIVNLAPGTYQIEIGTIGFEKITFNNLQITSSDQILELGVIVLTEKLVQINEVTVNAPGTPLYKKQVLSTSNVMSKKELERIQPIGTEEALKRLPGIIVAGDMGISNRLNVGIRGSYARRSEKLLVLEDGIPIAPAQYLSPEMYYNPPSDRLDGIEIIKGADVLTLGSNTMYGVINYITKRPPLKPTLGINLTSGNNGYHSQFVTYGGTWKNVGAEIQLLNKNFGGFIDNSKSHIFNTTAKIYADLGPKASVYMKVNYHQENSIASYSALTPFVYNLDPTINPFDADELTTRRYAVDLVYNQQLAKGLVLSSKVYANQFQRNWWRQENTLIKASDAEAYLGEAIFNDRYSFLKDQTFTDNDWIRVGKVSNGHEQTKARNRTFNTFGWMETLKYDWTKGNWNGVLELGAKLHMEQFIDVEFKNDSSRFARSGLLIKENKFNLLAGSAYVKKTLRYKGFSVAPAIRFESVTMRMFDLMKIAKDPNNDGSKNYGSTKNTFIAVLAGGSVGYDIVNRSANFLNIYSSLYQGYTPPTAGYGFLTVEDGTVSNPSTNDPINIKPERSLNFEIGTRANLAKELISTQIVYFNNNFSNFYSAGRNEAFETLGKVNIQGLEIGAALNLHKLFKITRGHDLTIGASITYMTSKITGGVLEDADFLKAKHTDASKTELIEKINNERGGFDVYIAGSDGDSLIDRNLTVDDFDDIKALGLKFGEGGIEKNAAPYIPNTILNFSINYSYKGIQVGLNFNMVGAQYTDYLNSKNETGEGAIGKLAPYNTVDANIAYSFENVKNKLLKGLTLFVAAKNLGGDIYEASRLHRVSSGIMPGGFRQVNGGLRFNW
jgi:Fe(3+) dicitrate transport protein